MTLVRPRVLVLSQSLPYPPHSGVANRTFNVLRQLRVAYDVDVVAFCRVNHHPDRAARGAARNALERIVASVAEPTPIPSEHSRLRKIWDHLRSLITGRAYTYYEYQSDAFAERLRAVLRSRTPDLVHLDSLDLHRWLPDLPRVPVACTHHNIESQLLRRYASGLAVPWRQYLRLQAERLERLERDWCPRLALNVMTSDVDTQTLRGLAPRATTLVVPNGTDADYFQPNGGESVAGRVSFVGPTYSFPNRDAVEFLLRDIWPRVRAADRAATLHLIGRGAAADEKRYAAEPGVAPLGHLSDIRPTLADTRCCVVPIRIGGGTRLKILDAWAMGKAVVATSIGCEGLHAVDGENILVRDTPEAFAEAVVAVLRDERLRARLEQNARRTATETYSWTVVGRRLRAAYDELLGCAPDADRATLASSSEVKCP